MLGISYSAPVLLWVMPFEEMKGGDGANVVDNISMTFDIFYRVYMTAISVGGITPDLS